MALYEKKIPFTTKLVDITKGEQYQPWYLKINPKGEVPVLKDGIKFIPDSVRIIDYLEDNFSNGMIFSLCFYSNILICMLINCNGLYDLQYNKNT